jgi:cobaltochelatase CobN
VPLEAFKRQWKARGIRRRVHLTIAGCLGPCAVANVVLLVLYGRSVWLHSIDSPRQVTAIYDYIERTLAAEAYVPLDESLAVYEFNRYTVDASPGGRGVCERSQADGEARVG